MNFLGQFGVEIWQVLVMMAPYLLFGFAVAGVLSLFLTREWVIRHLGGTGFKQVLKAALLGVPLPLCSCGVLPLAFSLRREGASKGATVSLLAATPQTGVDSILLTYSLLGPILAVVRVTGAFLTGIAAGTITDRADRGAERGGDESTTSERESSTACCCREVVAAPSQPLLPPQDSPAWLRALKHGFVTLPEDMAGRLVIGILLSGLVSTFVPEGFFREQLSSGLGSYLLALVVGVPMYVCSAASVPIAASFIHLGVSPGAAMVFLIAGPGVNATGIIAMWRQIGAAGTLALLGSLSVVAISAGYGLDTMAERVRASIPMAQAACDHGAEAMPSPYWSWLLALCLVVLLLNGVLGKLRRAA